MNIDYKNKKLFVDYIEKNLSSNQQYEILKILKEENVIITVNNNGYFINFSLLNDDILLKLNNFIKFLKANEENLKDKEYEVEKVKEFINDEKNEKKSDNENLVSSSYKNEIFDEYNNQNFENSFIINEKVDINSLNLKKIKTKFSGTKLKILRKYKDISKKSEINCNVLKIIK